MKNFLKEIRISIVATIVFTIVVCGVYPAIIWALGQAFFPWQANGSLITNKQGTVIGSELLGQEFTGVEYFQPRPSYAGNGYDPTASGGSNLGSTSQKLATNIQEAIAAYRTENNLATSTPVPADAVTGSASGLDPEISLSNANIQAMRVAKVRSITVAQVQDLIKQNTDGRSFGVLGEPGVNVLTLNIELDQKYPVNK